MEISESTPSKTLFALACAAIIFSAQPAAAQLATDLDCKGCVHSPDIADGEVKNSDIAKNAVDSFSVQNGSLTGTDVRNNSLNRTDIADEAGAEFHGANEIRTITHMDEVVRWVTITAPSSGQVIVVASGTWDEHGTPTTGRCSITTGTTITARALQEASLGAELDEDLTPFALTRGFAVSGPGTTTYRLVCDISSTTGNAYIRDAQMTAMYFPTVY